MSAQARLRGLRLVGFKSFAEKTVLEFGPGISAIIGPNGSGKSNLADALRWALGEQGRSLRTRRSEDVIFAGSAKRHATGMADVTLLVDNSDRLLPVDYAELDLGRRLFRSGENEYLLNRQRIRLRDLVELLEAANLADNAFLFIGQGMVDQALSLRPEERRPLFEEVAGVRRHERRRRQAEAQLQEAEANLARVRDIIGELRPQVRRLAVQAEQQAARQGAGEELAAALVALARGRWTSAAGTLAEASQRRLEVRATADAALARLTRAEEAVTELTARLGRGSEDAHASRAALEAARERLTELRLEEGRLAAEVQTRERELSQVGPEREAVEARLAAARRALALPLPEADPVLEAELAELERELASALAELARLEAAERAADEESASLRRAQAARQAEADLLSRRAEEARRRSAEAARAAARTADEASAAAAAAAEAATAHGVAMTAEAAAEEVLAAARATAQARQARSRAADAALAAAGQRHAARQGRLAALEAQLAAATAQGLVTAARRRGGRRVAEGLEVDAALRTAVEAALGETLRGAVAPAQALAGLRGETGHLVIEGATASPATAEAQRVRAAAGAAGGGPLGDAIRRDPTGVVAGLLACVVWVPDLPAALALQSDLPLGWRCVTRDGEVLGADGVARLGRTEATLERRAERDRLVAEMATAEQELGTLQAAADAATAAAGTADEASRAAQDDLEARRRERRHREEVERTAARLAETAAREAAWAAAQAERLEGEAARLGEALATATAPASTAAGAPQGARSGPADAPAGAAVSWRARVEELGTRRRSLMTAHEQQLGGRREAEDRRRRAEVGAGYDETRLAILERQASEGSAQLAELRERLARVRTELERAREAEASALAAVRALEAQEAEQRGRLAQQEAAAQQAREALRRAEEVARGAEMADLEARLALDTLREQLLVELAAMGPLGLAALRPDAAHLGGEAAGAAVTAALPGGTAGEGPGQEGDETLAAELEAALEAAVAAWGKTVAPEAAASPSAGRLAWLRRRYHELGAGNPFAAQEHAELQARLEGLENQQRDLVAAIEGTRRLIEELQTRISEQFRSTFAALEEAFAARFERLFGGGDARLELTDPEDLAATGVEIMARPPGKRRQPLAMLSGGERALTAVALLFAMLEVRPVPFCVLDEVDAALDEANVDRFTASLRELAEATQFIVITHNRGTIEAADALYGVTIGDDAVSRVISLRLAEATALAGQAS